MNKSVHKLKRLIQSTVLKTIKSLDYGREKRSSYEMECLIICKKMISRPESVLLLTPLTHKRYIKNDTLSIFITIDGGIVNVINHKYSYLVPMSDRSINEINNIFNTTVENQRKKMEDEITSNIKHSLRDISESLD